jgi:Na+/proline symporter/signal transduction histidine kinase
MITTTGTFIIASVAYFMLLFLIAYWADKKGKMGKSLVSNPYVYALSLAVYCTAWTFFGSVGRAANSGLSFLSIYLGPCIFAPLWLIVLRKMIIISKRQRITSIADFISSRYGKNTYIGFLVTIMAFIGIIPYIALQLKAVSESFILLLEGPAALTDYVFLGKTTVIVGFGLWIFTMTFGTRYIEPAERHEGLVAVIAFESIVKIVTFLLIGLFVTYDLYDGFNDLFYKASQNIKTKDLLFFAAKTQPSDWFWLSMVSLSAVILLPRQFHIAVVENSDPDFVSKALWMFPLYMLIINIFVLPIALAGILQPNLAGWKPDYYILGLPLLNGQLFLALLVFLGGLSAATSMVMVETTALSVMMSNHIILPALFKNVRSHKKELDLDNAGRFFIAIRRWTVGVILALAGGYFVYIVNNIPLVNIGLMSFALVMQFAPATFIGLFWKNATKSGAIAGLLAGFIVWLLTLMIPSLAQAGYFFPKTILTGYFGLSWLNPHALFGLEGYGEIAHASMWSLFFNVFAFIFISLNTRHGDMNERMQADYFVNIYKYEKMSLEPDISRREADVGDLVFLLNSFLGYERTDIVLHEYDVENKVEILKMVKANAPFVNYVETLLTGAVGAASARMLINAVVLEDVISQDKLALLDQTADIIFKNKELQIALQQLREANDRLQALDRLKADFIRTVTHELRTPMTSIRSLSKSLLKKGSELGEKRTNEFLTIIVEEADRLTRLVNQVLDIEKIQAGVYEWQQNTICLNDLVTKVYRKHVPVWDELELEHELIICSEKNDLFYMEGDEDRLTQVLINLIGNSMKFCPKEGGSIKIKMAPSVNHPKTHLLIQIKDNGIGIPIEKQAVIFDRFTQIDSPQMGKPKGTGLGLFITKTIVEHHKGKIWVESKLGEGATFMVELPLLKTEPPLA